MYINTEKRKWLGCFSCHMFSNIQSHLITIRMETKMGVRAATHQELLYSIEPSLFLQSCG